MTLHDIRDRGTAVAVLRSLLEAIEAEAPLSRGRRVLLARALRVALWGHA